MKLSAAEMRGIRLREIKYEKDAMVGQTMAFFVIFYSNQYKLKKILTKITKTNIMNLIQELSS